MLLAQVNVARMRGPIDAPVMREFADGFDPVNKLADAAPGFVWRLQTGGHAPLVEDGDGLWVVNVSLWRDYEALHDFVYRSPHAAFLRRRSRWFEPAAPPTTAVEQCRTSRRRMPASSRRAEVTPPTVEPVSATAFVTLAVSGGRPTASRLGNETTEASPAP